MKIARFSIFLFLIYFSFRPIIKAQESISKTDGIETTLHTLKTENKLSDWIYARIDFSYSNPRQQLPFLMDTQKKLWRKPASTPEKEAWLMLLSNQGYNQLYSGNILKSINCYEQAYNYYLSNRLNVAGISDYVLKPWANNYTRLGDYEKALFIQKKTLNYAKSIRDTNLMAAVYNNMAISYRSMTDYKNAESSVFSALKLIQPSSRENILLENVLADIYKEKNEFGLAEQVIERNIARQKKVQTDFETAYWLLSTYVTSGDIQFSQRHFDRAQRDYEQGLAINAKYYQGDRVREQAYILTQMGKVKLAQKQAKKALTYFNQALNTLGIKNPDEKNLFGDNRLVEVLYQKSLAEDVLGRKKESLSSIRLSLYASNKIRFELTDVKTRQRFQAESKQITAQAADLAFSLLKKTGQYYYAEMLFDIIEHAKARTLLDDIRKNQQQLGLQTKDTLFQEKTALERAITYQEKELLQNPKAQHDIQNRMNDLKFKLDYLEKELHLKYPYMSAASDESFSDVATTLKNLPKDAKFIEFFAGENQLYTILIKDRRIRHIHQSKDIKRIRASVTDFTQKYYQHGAAAMMNDPKAFFNASHAIYKSLMGSLQLRDISDVVLIPDEFLGHLSFDGLISAGQYTSAIKAWPFLIRKLAISYAFSVQTWLKQSHKTQQYKNDFQGIFLTHQSKDKQFIPAVAKEEKMLKSLIKGDFFSDNTASTKQFNTSFKRANVLHISTHAYLSGPQQEPTLAFNDGDIYLFELAAGKNVPDLVVLSACRTADGAMAAGEGVISLSRGFAAIGTAGTIAALWNVNDEAASAITMSFYQHLIAGAKTSSALHQAKLDWLRNKSNAPQNYLPYYWDALIYTGADQKIGLGPASNLATVLMVAFSIIMTFCIAYLLIRRNKKR